MAAAATAAATYAGYKYYNENVDKTIKSSTVLQNISRFSDKGVNDTFYASMTNSDNDKYRGMYSQQILKGGANSVYETKIGLNRNLKVASPKNVQKIMSEEMSKNPEFRQELTDWIKQSRGRYNTVDQNKVIYRAYDKIQKGIFDKEVYEAMNLSLVDRNGQNSKTVFSKFYGALKDHGYDAIMDINDMKYSGYDSKKPLIIFNGADAAFKKSARELTKTEIDNTFKKVVNRATAKEIAKASAGAMAPYGTTAAGAIAINNAVQKSKYNKIVNDYKKDHPNTNLTYEEIVNNYYSGKKD